MNASFTKVIKDSFPLLEAYTPVLARVHGLNHPELNEVRDLFIKINQQVKEQGTKVNLEVDFIKLREITKNYEVPSDGCETYEAVYQMLEASDKAYHSK